MVLAYSLWEKTGYKPHPKQLLYHMSNARFKIPACGRRFGKSQMAAAENEPRLFEPNNPGLGWIVAPTYDTADEFQYMYDDLIIKMGLGKTKGVRSANNPRTGEMFIQMPWGDKVVVKSAEKPTSLVGKGLKWCILSEAAKLPPLIFKKYIRPALSDRHAPCSFPSTPEGLNWYKQLHDRGKTDPQFASWNFPSWENPYVYPGGFEDPEIQSQMASAEDPWFWQEIGAKFTSIAGNIYGEFDEAIHVKPWTYQEELPNQLWLDFGFTNPFVALDVQITPSDEVHIWREYYVRQEPVHVHATVLRDRPSPRGYRIDVGYGDSADPNAVDTLGRILCPVIARPEAKDPVINGIREVKRFLRPPRLTVDPSCVHTIEEFNNYRSKEPGQRINAEDPREAPFKKDDHCMDAIRYGIMHQFVLGADSHLTEDFVGGDDDEYGDDEGSLFKTGADSPFTLAG